MPHLEPVTLKRPRIHFTAEDLPALRERAGGTHKFYYDVLMRTADEFARKRMPKKFGGSDADRLYGDMISVLAMAHLLSGEERHLKACVGTLEALVSLERWGDGLNLVTGHYASGVATGYDWLHDKLPEDLRRRMAEMLASHAERIVEYATSERIWWHDMFLQNWSHVITGGLACAAAALYGEDERAAEWIDYADGYFTKVVEALPEDGSYQEGQAYLTYALENMLRYWDLARQLFGRNHFKSEWIRNVPYFLVYYTAPDPRPLDNCMVFGDGLRHFEWHGPVHLLNRIAAEYKDAVLQGFASKLARRGIGLTRVGAWANMLWYDPGLGEKPLDVLATFKYFRDIDSVSMRSGWDEDATLVGFKCTNNMLRKTAAQYPGRDLGSGHAQPDAGAFQIYAFGQWLAISPGYTTWKRSEDHNTFVVNGAGQLGGERTWFDVLESQSPPCEITNVATSDAFDYARADASGIYRPAARLKRFIRHLVFLKPHDIFVVDELEGEIKSRFEWRLHTEDEILAIGDEFHVRKNDARARVVFLAPEDLKARVSNHKVVGASHTTPKRTVLLSARPAKKARRALFATLITVYRDAAPGSAVESFTADDACVRLTLVVDGRPRTVSLDLQNAKAQVT